MNNFLCLRTITILYVYNGILVTKLMSVVRTTHEHVLSLLRPSVVDPPASNPISDRTAAATTSRRRSSCKQLQGPDWFGRAKSVGWCPYEKLRERISPQRVLHGNHHWEALLNNNNPQSHTCVLLPQILVGRGEKELDWILFLFLRRPRYGPGLGWKEEEILMNGLIEAFRQ